MFKKLFILIPIFIFIFSFSVFANYDIDDRSDLIVYSGRSLVQADSAYSGTLSSLSNGNSLSIPFTGETVSVYLSSARNSGAFNIYIDGSEVYSGSISPSVNYNGKKLAWSSDSLSSSDHLLTIVCPDNSVVDAQTGYNTSGRVYFDYISFASDPAASSSDVIFIICMFLLFIVACLFIFSLLRKVMAL